MCEETDVSGDERLPRIQQNPRTCEIMQLFCAKRIKVPEGSCQLRLAGSHMPLTDFASLY
jgi:hypothetical protein